MRTGESERLHSRSSFSLCRSNSSSPLCAIFLRISSRFFFSLSVRYLANSEAEIISVLVSVASLWIFLVCASVGCLLNSFAMFSSVTTSPFFLDVNSASIFFILSFAAIWSLEFQSVNASELIKVDYTEISLNFTNKFG